MFADIVSYSRMMGANEKEALKLLADFDKLSIPVIEKFNRVLVSLPQLQAACLPSLSLGRDRVTFFYIAPKPRRIRKGWYSPSLRKRIVKVTRLLTDEEKGRCLSSLSLSGLRDTDRFGNVHTPPNWRARRFSKEHLSWI